MKQINRSLWKIALPLLLNMLVSQVQIIIDRAFLGHIRVEYMSALGNVSAPLWTSIAVLWALASGATILMSQAIGAGKLNKAEDLAHNTMKYSTLAAGIIFLFWFTLGRQVFLLMGVEGQVLQFCMDYMRYLMPMVLFMGLSAAGSSILQSNGTTKPILISGIVRSGLNVLLDWILIFGRFGFPEMGIKGAALATSIAEITGTIILITLVLRSDKLPFRLTFNKILKSEFNLYKKIARKGIPTATEELLWNLGNLGIIRILNSISAAATGIYTMIFSIDIFPAMIFVSIGQGVMTLTGQKTGANDTESARKVGLVGLINSWLISVFFLVLFLLIPRLVLGIFTSDREIISQSVIFLVIASFNFFPRSANLLLGAGIRGYGDTKWMLKTQVLGTIEVLTLSLLFVYVLKMGILGVFLATFLDETIRAFINYLRYRKGPETKQEFRIIEEGIGA